MNYFNLVVALIAALVICFQAISFMIKKQEFGTPYVQFGALINSAIYFVFIPAPQLFNIISDYYLQGKGMPIIEFLLLTLAIVAAFYLSFQRSTVTEGGILSPPILACPWINIKSYNWDNQTLFIYGNRHILFLTKKKGWQIKVPEDKVKQVDMLLKLYLPFKKTDNIDEQLNKPGKN